MLGPPRVLRLLTRRGSAASLREHDVNVLASRNLRVRRNQAVMPFARADQLTRRRKGTPEINGVPESLVEKGVPEVGPFDLVLATERRMIGIGGGNHQRVGTGQRTDETSTAGHGIAPRHATCQRLVNSSGLSRY